MARILVVDDAIFMREVIKAILVKGGHKVVAEASNGEEAYRRYVAYKPDLVTMDITMPDTDGVEGVKMITEYDPEANIVMVSALGYKSMVIDAVRYGAKNFIVKPIEEEKVLSVVNGVLKLDNVAKYTQQDKRTIAKSIEGINNTIGSMGDIIRNMENE